MKKAITSNAVYHPNLLENVSFLVQEVIGSVKWRKLVSLYEATGALSFFEDLDKELGSKRLNDEEVRFISIVSSPSFCSAQTYFWIDPFAVYET